MTVRRRPDVFLVGAPKAGTTAMYTYLGRHPDIFVPARKELRFFGSDLVVHDRVPLTLDDYEAFFANAGSAQRVATAYVWYLFSQRAAAEIARYAPDASILVMLREPVDMLHALHAEHLTNGNEDIGDFAAALEAEADRRRGKRLPPHVHLPQGLLYSTVPRYAEQLERYFAVFGRDRVHVTIFDDFTSDPAACYRQVLRFLGVADDGAARLEDFDVVNPNRRLRSEHLRQLLSRPPELPRRLIRTTVPQSLRRRLHAWAKRANVRAVPRAAMAPETRERLQALFAPEVERLETLLGRDLSSWRSRPSEGASGTRDRQREPLWLP